MNIVEKFKETAASVLPVAAIVLALGLTIVPLKASLLLWFIASSLFLVVGLTLFLLGVDMGISPVGERCGAALTEKRSLPILLFSALAIGFIVTIAEPDIQVFATQVKNVFSGVNGAHLTYAIAAGVGLFMAIGLLRTISRFSFKITVLVFYALLAGVACLAPKAFIGIAFDSGGATTGPMTVPFIMALGLGVSAVRSDKNGSFGLTGIVSIGPVLAVMIYSLFVNAEGGPNVAETSMHGGAIGISASTMVHSVKEATTSILPLFLMTVVFQIFLFKMTKRQLVRVTIGFVYAFIGLCVFLVGVNGGFMQAGEALGGALGDMVAIGGIFWYGLMLATGLAFGAIIVCAEPAVWVLGEQVEEVTGGLIRRKSLLVFLSIGTALAIALAMIRAVTGFHIAWILIPGYLLAMALMPFCPTLFSGIAFDSGGVASGPLTSSFVLSFTLGAAAGGTGASDSFGVIALVAMMPLIAIQVMGIIFESKKRKAMSLRKES